MQLALALHPDAVTYEQDLIVHAYIASALPKDVPTYVRRVIAFTSIRRGFVARIEVPDGGLMDVTITGQLGAAGYSWRMVDGRGPLSWCPRKRRWVRIPDRWKADDG